MVVLYVISFGLISANIILSCVYLETQFSLKTLPYIRPHPVHNLVASLYVTSWTEVLGSTFDILSLFSFLAIWISTITLFTNIGIKRKELNILFLQVFPLIYYLIPFYGTPPPTDK